MNLSGLSSAEPEVIPEAALPGILQQQLPHWKLVISPHPEGFGGKCAEIFRQFEFKNFAEAIRFMSQMAPACDAAGHHPRWENTWRTLKVYLTTHDCAQRVSNRDVQLARYFDGAYEGFAGAVDQRPADERC